ncbi:MAG: GNAT family N-acetyltransferase [Candidatus Competibacteraceae bacterium]|jgi:hypothetical protein|nr:GNAT family N-acetyltransferase [Candidatus Competibacteraceae bacterium]
MQVTVHRSINEIEPLQWDSIVGTDRIIFSHACLKAIEASGINDCRFFYLAFWRDNGEIAAHVPVYSIPTDLLIFSNRKIKNLINFIRKRKPFFLQPRFLECGSPACLGQPFSLREGVMFSDIVELLSHTLDSIAISEGIRFILLRDFLPAELTTFRHIKNYRFYAIENLPNTELEIRWQSYDDYVASMRSRYRYKLKRQEQLWERAGFKSELHHYFSTYAEELAQQWKNVNINAKEYNREQINSDFYRNLDLDLELRCRVLAIIKGSELVAHAFLIFDDNVLRWLYFGRKHVAQRDNVYLFTASQVIKLAIEEKLSILEMGITNYTVKLELGAKIVPLFMFLRFRGPLLAYLLPRLHQLFNSPPKIEPANVFKKV